MDARVGGPLTALEVDLRTALNFRVASIRGNLDNRTTIHSGFSRLTNTMFKPGPCLFCRFLRVTMTNWGWASLVGT
jgi:hypothetical protein